MNTGTSLPKSDAAPPNVGFNPDDEATRYLAAAVHLDSRLADAVIEECLAEPHRVVPPAPGVRAHIVLREAVAAQEARSISNVALLILLAVLAMFGSILLVIWLSSALAWRVSTRLLTRRSTRPSWAVTALAWLPLMWLFNLMLGFPVALLLFASTMSEPASDSYGSSSSDDVSGLFTGLFAVVGLAAVAIAGIALVGTLFIQRYLPWHIVTRFFQFGHFHPNTPPREFVTRACRPFAARLHRIAAEDHLRQHATPRNVIVYRGASPFVGAGARVRTWSQAIDLHSVDPAVPIPEFTAADLQHFIADDVDGIRKSPDITPGQRFAGLEISDAAFLAAGQLLHYPEASFFVNELVNGRNPVIGDTYWDELLNRSPEWLRHYRCFRLDAWEKQVAVAGYLHIGYERRTLYVEWSGFVLPPVAPEYRTVDTPPRWPYLHAGWQAVCDLAVLPTSVPARVGEVARWVRASYGIGRGRTTTPAQAANALGALSTVREIGAGRRLPTFFQASDSDQYLKILERRVLDAMHRFLASRGISTELFNAMVTQINNSTVMEGCTVVAGNIGGSANQGSINADNIRIPAAQPIKEST
ncbi:hypothetical protein ACFWUP_04770 [Nocardia sp. NPDC058658]|uniref:hypothetical protein n=1 Tax=Nocardia sp. NPDC058658 TaxID=3346580 RepID=UPI003648611A